MDRLVAPGSASHGWLAFAGPRGSHELSASLADAAKARGLPVEVAFAGASARVTLAYPEGEAAIDLFDVEGDARTRLAICRRGPAGAVAQARAFLRETLDRDGGIDALLACDAASWRSLAELAPHRAAVARRTASNVLAGLGWVLLVPSPLLMLFFGYGALEVSKLPCGPDGHPAAGAVLTPAVFGLVFFALAFVPGARLQLPSRRTFGRSIGGVVLLALAFLIALGDIVLVAGFDAIC